jgi:hypothetical protein
MMLKKILSLVLLLLLVNAFPAVANPTPTQRKSTRSRRPAPTPTPAPAPAFNFVAEANLVADQLRSVSQFIYIYGKIVNGLELADAQTKEGAASPTAAAKNKEIKDKLGANINTLRAGIDAIASRFRSESRLQVQYLKLTGASDAIATAAQLATAGRYDDAGKSLVTAVQRLSETIIALR